MRGLKIAVDAKGGKAFATITNKGVFIARFETEDKAGLIRRLDRAMEEYNFSRVSGYVSEDGFLVADGVRVVRDLVEAVSV